MRLLFGILLILFSLSFLVAELIRPRFYVDFPCWLDQHILQPVDPNSRINYCISLWPRDAISGGGIYAFGTSEDDREMVTSKRKYPAPFTLVRVNDVLSIDDHILKTDEVYETSFWSLSWNIWKIHTTRLNVRNDGFSPETFDAINVSGNVIESWLPNPVGFLIFFTGIWLTHLGLKERKNGQQNLPQPEMK